MKWVFESWTYNIIIKRFQSLELKMANKIEVKTRTKKGYESKYAWLKRKWIELTYEIWHI